MTATIPDADSLDLAVPRLDESLRILLIEDNPGDARLIRELLADVPSRPFVLESVSRLASGLERLARGGFDVVLLDLLLPDSRGLDTFTRLQRRFGDLPVVVLTGLDDEELALASLQAGAQDYLVKGNVTSNSLARSMRHAVERARRHKAEALLQAAHEEFRIAREIQQRFFPDSPPSVPGFDCAGASYSAEATGGDYFDFIPMQQGAVGVVIADVSGHGFGPALLMAETRAYLRALALTRRDVAELITLVNQFLAADTDDERFVTLFLGRLDPTQRSFVYTSAGHLAGYVLDRQGQTKALLESTGFPLGIDVAAEYTAAPAVQLEPGDIVFLLTDGVIEAFNGTKTLFGVERALQVIAQHRAAPARQIVEALYAAVCEFCQCRPHDDCTMIVVKVDDAATPST